MNDDDVELLISNYLIDSSAKLNWSSSWLFRCLDSSKKITRKLLIGIEWGSYHFVVIVTNIKQTPVRLIIWGQFVAMASFLDAFPNRNFSYLLLLWIITFGNASACATRVVLACIALLISMFSFMFYWFSSRLPEYLLLYIYLSICSSLDKFYLHIRILCLNSFSAVYLMIFFLLVCPLLFLFFF